MIVGRPFRYGEKDISDLKNIVKRIGEENSIPVLFGADIGHTDPMMTVPLGVLTEMDSKKNKFEINESGVL